MDCYLYTDAAGLGVETGATQELETAGMLPEEVIKAEEARVLLRPVLEDKLGDVENVVFLDGPEHLLLDVMREHAVLPELTRVHRPVEAAHHVVAVELAVILALPDAEPVRLALGLYDQQALGARVVHRYDVVRATLRAVLETLRAHDTELMALLQREHIALYRLLAVVALVDGSRFMISLLRGLGVWLMCLL